MIGDDLEVDIQGARTLGMDQIFVNYQQVKHQEQVTYEVYSFPELQDIL